MGGKETLTRDVNGDWRGMVKCEAPMVDKPIIMALRKGISCVVCAEVYDQHY